MVEYCDGGGRHGRAESHNGGDAEGPLTSSPEEQSHLTFYRFSGLFLHQDFGPVEILVGE